MNMLRVGAVIAILLVVTGVVVVLIVAPEEITGRERVIAPQPSEEEEAEEEFIVTPDGEVTRRPAGGAGAGGGGGGGGGSSGGSTSSCYLDSSSYGLLNLAVSQTCLQQSGACTEKNIECAITVRNLDQTQAGTFVLEAKLYEQGTSPASPFTTAEVSASLGPGDSERVEHMFYVSGPEADIDWTCSFETVSVPSEEIC